MNVEMIGSSVVAAMKEKLQKEVEELKQKNCQPCLGIIRVGARGDDLAYERGAQKRMESIGIGCEVTKLPEDITQEDFERAFQAVNDNPNIHGILLFRPLPEHLDEEPLKAMIHPWKDADCMSDINIAKVFLGDDTGYAPCTAEAVIEMLDFYNVDLEGKNVTIIGRSMVVGKPLSMLLVKRNATVTICHTRTKNMSKICRKADILVVAAGKAKMVTEEFVGKGSVVIDVGINVDDDGSLCGDVVYDEVAKKAGGITPVPRGVGSVTASVLAKHVVKGAKYQSSCNK